MKQTPTLVELQTYFMEDPQGGMGQPPKPARSPSFAASTIQATIWLMVYHPGHLREWLDRHPPGDVLEKIAMGLIFEAEKRKHVMELLEVS